EASGRDLSAWSSQWLESSGTSTLNAELEAAGDGHTVSRLLVHQEDTGGTLRDHRLVVGWYSAGEDGRLHRTHRVEADVTGAVTQIDDARGLPVPDLLLLNDDDLSYAKVRLDPRSTATALRAGGTIAAPLSRAVLWSALWN